jgi:hypothetical protein
MTSLNNDLQIVVARYKEPLGWLQNKPFNKYPVIIYNKGGDENYYKASNIVETFKLPNIGLEIHSFLTHIINNYDNLANITAFFQGSIDLPHKYYRAVTVVNECVERNTTVLPINETHDNVCKYFENFEMLEYPMSHPSNPPNHTNSRTVPSAIRPFGAWYKHLFGDTITNFIGHNHIIAIKKEHILRNNKQYYENLIHFVDYIEEGKQPEVVHFFERAWEAIFFPLERINFVAF